MRSRLIPVLVLAAAVATGCASGTPASPGPETPAAAGSPTPPSGPAVTIAAFAFDPPRLEVRTGAAVTWTNAEDALHTVTAGTPDAPTGLFDSGEFDTGETFAFTFSDAGTYPFFCARHDFMAGEIVVGP